MMKSRFQVETPCTSLRLPVLLCWLVQGVAAEEIPPRADKSQYHLLNPTPASLMRELSTDRPDQTESPRTVDAGHFQLEMDFVRASFDEDNESGGGGTRTETWAVAPMNLKLGLLNNLDLQLVLEPYVHSRTEDHASGRIDEASGFGDLQTRVKVNLWGNDSGRTAVAVMPFVKWPLDKSALRNGRIEGGVIFPFGVDLGRGWGLGGMTEFDFVADEGGEYETEFVNTLEVGRDITRKLGMYLEFRAMASSAGSDWEGQVDVGWTYALKENIQLDWGCNFGVTESAPDYTPFVGVSVRY